jgi:hypothetical protein
MERGVAPCLCGLAAPFSILRESANTAIQIESFPRLDHPPDTGGNLALRSAQAGERDHKIAQALFRGVNISASTSLDSADAGRVATFVESSGTEKAIMRKSTLHRIPIVVVAQQIDEDPRPRKAFAV